MTQINAGVSFKGRLPQIVGQAALAASVLAGGASLLNAGGAMADACTGTNGANYDLTVIAPPLPGGTTLCSSPVGLPPAGNKFVAIDTKFTPERPGPETGETRYFIHSLEHAFIAVQLDSDFDLNPGSVTKTLWADKDFSIPILTASPLVSTDGSNTGLVPILNPTANIYVKDSYTVGAGGQLDNYTNTFQTPGPLPILGAGAAFGFSRKLRSRIKVGRTA